MSATAVGRNRRFGGTKEAPLVRAYFLSTSVLVAGFLVGQVVGKGAIDDESLWTLVAWGIVIAVADFLPVRVWGPITLSMSLPVALAVGMLFDPVTAAIVAFAASVDPREVRGKISPSRALYNRSQIALSVLLASWVFHSTGGVAGEWPGMIGAGLLALAVDCVVNIALVVIPASLISGDLPQAVVRKVVADSPVQYALGYLVLGVFAILLATVAVSAGVLAAVAFLAPLALARLTFVQALSLGESVERLQAKNEALKDALERVAEERRDERLVVAGELHDEVLPPLFKVHLMGQVLRQDLSSGRLLDLDEDLPELLSATQVAQGAIREILGDLRRSAIGPGGLNSTISLLARQLENAGSPRIELQLNEVGGSKLSQLLVYQVIREAMANAARYSKGTSIRVGLWLDDGLIRLVVEDDGIGFAQSEVDQNSHFGLQFIRERVEAANGHVVVDSMLGAGTRVVASIPSES